MKFYEYFIGIRYLRAKPAQTLMSTGGVVLGIVVVIVSLSIFSGFQETLRNKLLGAEAHLVIWPGSGLFEDYEALAEEVRGMPKVAAVSPAIVNQALLRNYFDEKRLSGAQVRGLDPATASSVSDINTYLDSKNLSFDKPDLLRIAKSRGLEEGDTVFGGIILGSYLARRLGVQIGDPLIVFAEFKRGGLGGGIHPVTRIFVVLDTYRSGLYEVDANVSFIALDVAQRLYSMDGQATQIEVKTLTPDDADGVQQEIMNRYGIELFPKTWKELRGNFFTAMEMEKRLTFVILGLIILVAAFSIAITLIMLVMEKTREIGVLKAMGSANGSILRIFMLNGTLIGVVGAVLGTAIALFLCWILEYYLRIPLPGDVYQIDYVPVKVSWEYIALVNGLSIVICWIATLYPAFRAAKMKPLEALRYE